MYVHDGYDSPSFTGRASPGFESLVGALGYDSLADWLARWAAIDGLSLAHEAWPVGVDPRWIASVGLPLLDHVQQSPPRSLLGLAAMPGCGKSTLVSLIQRFYDPTSGTVELDNLGPLTELHVAGLQCIVRCRVVN